LFDEKKRKTGQVYQRGSSPGWIHCLPRPYRKLVSSCCQTGTLPFALWKALARTLNFPIFYVEKERNSTLSFFFRPTRRNKK
jgi:hypothetical protein